MATSSVKQVEEEPPVEEPVVVVHKDPFNPVLTTPNPLDVTDEQLDNIRAILETACSDSRFVEKAFKAIVLTLMAESVVPVIASLTPDTGVAGTGSTSVTVAGQNFESGSVVLQAGAPVNTNFTNEMELLATLDLSGASAGVLAISVRNSDGLTSNVVNFTVTESLLQSSLPTPVEEPSVEPVVVPPPSEESFTKYKTKKEK